MVHLVGALFKFEIVSPRKIRAVCFTLCSCCHVIVGFCVSFSRCPGLVCDYGIFRSYFGFIAKFEKCVAF